MNLEHTVLFFWGVSTSSHQVEGGNSNNDWARWEASGHVRRGEVCGVTCDYRRLYKEDIDRIASLGCNAYRFSIEWSRVQPERNRWDEAELAWYREVVELCRDRGIEPMVTLLHFTLPAWFADLGAFTQKSNLGFFEAYCEKVVQSLAPSVKYWCTLNEPMVAAGGSYLAHFMPPATWAPVDFVQCSRNLVRAHVVAFDTIKKYVGAESQVGIAINMLAFEPVNWWSPLDRLLARFLDRFYNWQWIRAVMGEPTRFYIPFVTPVKGILKEAQGRRTVDFLGVNYYTKARVGFGSSSHADANQISELPLKLFFSAPGDRVSDLGWAHHPKGLKVLLRRLGALSLPLIITENGIATEDDHARQRYLCDHLSVVAEARASGVDVQGYFHWSLMDNFEWIEGFSPRFGLYAVDYTSQKRKMRPSGSVYRQLIEQCGAAGPQQEAIDQVAESLSDVRIL